MDSPKLKTLYDLLAEGYTVAQLANAVETHGIHGWDRFGRFGKYKGKSSAADQALDALAEFYQREEEFWMYADKQSRPKRGEEPDHAVISRHEKIAGGMSTLDIYQFGWPVNKVPVMQDAANFPPAPNPKRPRISESPTLHVLGALLVCLEQLKRSGKTMRMPSEDTLIGMMEDAFPGVKWVAKTTIQYNFADSKAAVEAAKRPT